MVTVERAVADGDVAVIDFEGFVDDVAFEGGKARTTPWLSAPILSLITLKSS